MQGKFRIDIGLSFISNGLQSLRKAGSILQDMHIQNIFDVSGAKYVLSKIMCIQSAISIHILEISLTIFQDKG